MVTVEWRPVVGYLGLYEVSNDGRVRSLNYNGTGEVRELRPASNYGYLRVELCKNGERKMFTIHRLVATAFIPNPQDLPVINHKDEDKTNNTLSNLEWCTVKYNSTYSLGKPVLQFTKDGKFVAEYESIMHAERHTGIANQNISKCCLERLKHKSAGGFIWRYKQI